MTGDPTANRVPDQQPAGVGQAPAEAALTPLRAVVLPGLTEPAEPAPPSEPAARRLPRFRRPGRSTGAPAPQSEPVRVTQPASPPGGPASTPATAPAVTTSADATAPVTTATGPVAAAATSAAPDPMPASGAPMDLPERRHTEPVQALTGAARRTSRRLRVALAAAAAVVLIGPLVYAFSSGSGAPPERAASLPVVGAAQPWPEDSPAGAALPGAASAAPDPSAAGSSQLVPTSGATKDTTTAPGAGGGNGAGGGQPTTQAGALAPPPAATTVAAKASSTRIAGVGCANNDSQNWYANAMDGQWSEKAGGASGCGRSLAMPMSGDASYDTSPYVVWWFVTKPVVTGSCAISVYVPSTGVANDVAGHPAYYKVLGGRTSSTVAARFAIDQTVNRGRWVDAGTHQVRNGEISVHLANRGSNPGGQRIGAAQVRLSCTAA